MTHYPDLSPYDYLPDTIPDGVELLAVGWLSADEKYTVGEPPAGFLESLAALCRDHVTAKTRGWHACELDHPEPPDFPYSTDHGGITLVLGHGEVRVVAADGRWLAAPDLVFHYVRDHGYLPPEEFVEAVAAGRVAPEPDWD